MLRLVMFLAIGATLVSAFGLYAVTYSTRQLEIAKAQAARQHRQLVRDVAVLRAERAYLARPSRLEPLARRLGMRPVEGHQFMTPDARGSHGRR